MWGKVCVWLEITICEIKRTRVWVLILSKLFQLPAFGWVIYQFICFWGRDNSSRFSTVWGIGGPTPHVVQGSTVFPKLALGETENLTSQTLLKKASWLSKIIPSSPPTPPKYQVQMIFLQGNFTKFSEDRYKKFENRNG